MFYSLTNPASTLYLLARNDSLMNTYTSNIILSAFAAGMIPVYTFGVPDISYAASLPGYDSLSTTQQQALNQQELVVIKDDLQLADAQLQLQADRAVQQALHDHDQDSDSTWFDTWRNADGQTWITQVFSDVADTIVVTSDQAYNAAEQRVATDQQHVTDDAQQLHDAANVYRGLLFADGLSVPNQLPFVTGESV